MAASHAPRKTTGVTALLTTLALATWLPAVEPGQSATALEAEQIDRREPTRFIRIRYDEFENPLALQTGTAKYVLKDSSGNIRLEVSLESAVHVADRGYYRGFNRRFPNYDVVLYEFVASRERPLPSATPEDELQEEAEGESRDDQHPLKMVHKFVVDALGFSNQGDEIDYQAENLVHADLSLEEMQEAKRKRGDDSVVLLADALVDVIRQMNRVPRVDGTEDAEVTDDAAERRVDFSILSDPDGAVKVRRLLAGGLTHASRSESPLGRIQTASIIRDRNQRAMQVFQQQLDEGKRRIAFFWGAAHMPDFEKDLILGYGLEPAGVVWRDAWDLREGAVERAPLAKLFDKALRGVLDDAGGLLDELQKSLDP